MDIERPQLTVSRVFEAPRDLFCRAFTDPDQLAAWWGPIGNPVLRDEIEFDVRPGGTNAGLKYAQPNPAFAFTSTSTSHTSPTGSYSRASCPTGQLSDGIEPFATRFRIEFHDEADERTRLEIRQWLSEDLAGPSEQGWLQAFTKLDATLTTDPATVAVHRDGATWES
jgi:uncharacterized protein YndB with AHSA1/START domain